MQSKHIVTRKIQRPDGADPNTPLEQYEDLDKYYSIYTFEDDCEIRTIYKTDELHGNHIKRLKELLVRIRDMHKSDLGRIEAAIILIDFLIKNNESFPKGSTSSADIITLIFTFIHKISEQAKQRNQILIADNGWWLFDLLGKLFSTKFTHSEPVLNQMPDYYSFRNLMLPKIIAEDLPEIRTMLLQMHDTELAISTGICDTIFYPPFSKNPDVFSKIVELQKNIEEKISLSQKTEADEFELTRIVKKFQLQAKLTHIHFFCKTINNYHSLKKLISIIETIENVKDITTEGDKEAFLFCLGQIGEYMSHRKLSNKFREAYPYIPWNIYQQIRDSLLHPEENLKFLIINDLLDDKLTKDGISFKLMLTELSTLKAALQQILDHEYHHPPEKFHHEFAIQYTPDITDEESISEDDISFFLSQLSKNNVALLEKWKAILSGKIHLPQNKEDLGKLLAIISKPHDPTKEARLQCEKFIDALGEVNKPISTDSLTYLRNNLLIPFAQRDEVELIIAKVGKSLITKKDKVIFKNYLPKAQNERSVATQKRIKDILARLEDIRDKGDSILYPSEKKLFEQCALYKNDPQKWSRIILGKQQPTMDEIRDIEDLELTDLKPIAEKIGIHVFKSIASAWSRKLCPEEIDILIKLLEKYPLLKWKWLKILNGEFNYPEMRELTFDFSRVMKNSKEDATEFWRIIKKLSPVTAPAPTISCLCTLFNAKRAESYYNRDVVNLAMHHISKIQDSIIFYIPNRCMLKYSSDPSLTSFILRSISEFMRTNPTYEVYYSGMSQLLSTLSGKSQALNVDILSKKFFDNYKESYLEVLRLDLPKTLEENAIFRDAITFNLTIAIALLKKIIKYPEARLKPFLTRHYISLKQGRNDLIHGNYIRESFNENQNSLIYSLYLLMGNLLAELNSIGLQICKSEETKAWAQVAIMRSFITKRALTKPATESLVSMITNLAYPHTYTSSEQNFCFKSTVGFAGKFFKKSNVQKVSTTTSKNVIKDVNAVKDNTRRHP